MATLTKQTEEYIKKHPSIKDCLKKNVINYSKLARLISNELGIKANMEALLIACRRYRQKIESDTISQEKIIKLLGKSEMQIKNRIAVAIINKDVYRENLFSIERKIIEKADTFYAIEGSKVITVILGEKYIEELRKIFGRKVINYEQGLAMITINSPEDLEAVPGVVSYLYSLFSEHSVNLVETLSCWTDTIFVIDEKDIPVVMEFMKF